MFDFLSNLFNTSDFPARWHCGQWTAGHGWLHIFSDLGIWSAYFAIPCLLVYFASRRADVPFRKLFWLFGAFILACGTTHLMEAAIFWWPAYRLAGIIKLVTAIVSWTTIIALVPTIPKALALRSPQQLEEEVRARTEELSRANRSLAAEVAERKRTEEALRESEERFRAIVTQTTAGIAQVDGTGQFVQVNQRYCELVGRSEEELYRLRMQEITHPDDLPHNLHLFEQAVQEGTPFVIEKRYVRPDGSLVWVNASVGVVRDRSGNPQGVLAVATDITSRKESETALKQIEWLLTREPQGASTDCSPACGDLVQLNTSRVLAEAVGEAVLTEATEDYLDLLETSTAVYERNGDYALNLQASGYCHFLTDASRKLCGTEDDRAALTSGKWHCHESCWEASKQSMETGAPADIACKGGIRLYAVAIKAGEEVVGSINFGYGDPPQDEPTLKEVADRYGVGLEELRRQAQSYQSRPPFLVDVAKDRLQTTARLVGEIVQRRRLEESLRQRIAELAGAEERIRSVVENVVDGIITIDAHGTVESLNPAAEAIFGYAAPEILGQNVRMLMPEPYQSEHDGYIANYLTTGQAKIIGIGREVLGRRKDGSTFPMELAVSKFNLEDGRYFTGIVRDISERKRAEDELRRIAAELSEANRRKSEFLATLAHELRNPLAPIRTGLEVMKMVRDDPATMEEIRSTMERQTQQLVTLVDDLLDVSRITRGKLELRKCRVKLSDVVQSAVEASKPFIDEAGHELAVAVPEQPIYMDADPHRLAQVLSNLLNNATKYTPEGGRIWLNVERQGSDVLLTVRDTGVGIPSEMRDRIFEMFAQIQGPMEKGYVGLGIGLTLVKSLVEMHSGRIEVHSDGPNRGSEFRVRLPILVEMPVGKPQQIQPDEGAAIPSKRRVLVVDDNKAAADMLSMIVKMLGNEVRTASNGQEAIEIAAEFLPDVVLMDIGMPKMNGYEAARHIRQQPWGEKMMLVALTGWGQDEDKQRTKEAGFDHHLVKPAEPAVLQKLLAEAVQ